VFSKISTYNEAPFIKNTIDLCADLKELGYVEKHKKNSTFIIPGQRIKSCYYVVNGRLKYSMISADGREILIGLLEPKSIFGEVPLFDSLPAQVNIQALQDSELIVFSHNSAIKLLKENIDFAHIIMFSMCQKIRVMMTMIENISNTSCKKRIIRLLYYFCNYQYKSNNLNSIKITHEQIAMMTGIHRVTVSKLLSELKESGVISLSRNKIIFESSLKLKELFEDIAFDQDF